MLRKLGNGMFIAATACAIFSACSDNVNNVVDSPPTSSDDIIPQSSSEALIPGSSAANFPASSSTVVPADSSDSTIPTSSSEVIADVSSSSVESTPADTSAIINDPSLLWHDEFDGAALDLTKWTREIGNSGWGNNEYQYYTDRTDNAYVKDGILHVAAKKEEFETAKYTSARLITKGKFDFAYGTVEARIALPVGKGIWPAFWMLGANIDDAIWPLCGEIDIIETVNDEHVVYGTHHWSHEGTHAQYGNSTKQHFDGHYELDITEFHNYKMTWDKNAISMYVDDFMYQKIDITDASGEMGTFHKPFFFILNVAVGGNWPGFDIDDSQFPNEMLVDYIRVYK